MRDINNSSDVLDSRDIIARIDELESNFNDAQESGKERYEAEIAELEEGESEDDIASGKEVMEDGKEIYTSSDFGETEYEELKTLKALADQCEGYGDWRHGEALIRDSYFQDYAQELAEDIGAVNKDARWPNNFINWEEAAEALKEDYTEVDFDGVAYWMRT